MPGGRAALPVGGGLAGIVVTVLILLLGGGGGYGVDSPFEQFPMQPAAGGTTMDRAPDAESELVDFSSFVVGDLQKFWADDFRKGGRPFTPTKLALFRNGTDTGCGPGSAQTGPFYCPLDRKIYLDLGFFHELAQRFQAPGDFAQAATGRISPETFTHGTAEQRTSWFKRGFDGGDATACDTFSGEI